MAVDRVAQIGGDALAQPAHHVKAHGREDAQREGHAEQLQKMAAQAHGLGAAVARHQAAVDQLPQGHREHQRGGGGQHQKQHRQRDLPAVRLDERQQAAQGFGVARLGALGLGFLAHSPLVCRVFP